MSANPAPQFQHVFGPVPLTPFALETLRELVEKNQGEVKMTKIKPEHLQPPIDNAYRVFYNTPVAEAVGRTLKKVTDFMTPIDQKNLPSILESLNKSLTKACMDPSKQLPPDPPAAV